MSKITWLMNRKKFLVALFMLLFMFSLYSPMNPMPYSSLSEEGVNDLFPIKENWFFADSPEGAVVHNNREEFIDILTDLHPESDIGSHSNPLTLRIFDGIFDTVTSDNITIPAHWVIDPMEDAINPPYFQEEYESWNLDLEGGWTNIDFDEINAEICVYGGVQAAEALRVDIWSGDVWIDVIKDVQTGWNNVSILESLEDETLEVRFTNTDNTNSSVQSSWEIDCVLLHTWTTIYSSEFTQGGLIQDVGDDLFRYRAAVGETNTYDEVTGTWHRYLYDPDTKSVKIGNLTITHLPGGALSIDGDTGSRVGRLSWYIQYYYNDVWQNLTLSNYEFVGFTKTTDDITMHQRYWDVQGEMNIYLTYSYHGGFKTKVDITNNAAIGLPIRTIWAAQDVRGLQDNYELIYTNDVLSGIQIEDATFSWYDVLVSDNPLPTQTVVDKPNRRAAVIFGNMSTVIPAGYTATIDPTYTVLSDGYDTEWEYWEVPDEDATRDYNRIGTDGVANTYEAMFRVAMAIPEYSIVTDATITVVESVLGDACPAIIYRLNSVNVGTLEGQSRIAPDTSSSGTITFTGAAGTRTASDVGVMIQKSINTAGWVSGNGIGFTIRQTSGTNIAQIYDFQQSGDYLPELTVIFSAPSANWLSGYGFRQGHSIDGSTGASTDYQIKINVEYGSGTSADGTIYCNEHCDTDFDDIHYTESDGETPLDYWLEEKTDSDDATFWVEVSANLDSDQFIYVYYGKTGDSSDSDGEATFLFFDDFEDGSVDGAKWDTHGTVTEADGLLTTTTGAGTVAHGQAKTDSTWSMQDKSVESMYQHTVAGGSREFGTSVYASDNYRLMLVSSPTDAATDHYINTDGGAYDDYSDWHDWSVLETMTRTRFTITTAGDKNSLQLGSDTHIYSAKTMPSNAMPILLGFWYPTYTGSHTGTSTQQFEWVFMRTAIGVEPSSYTWTAQETPPPINHDMSFDNPDDGSYMYARHKTYTVSTNVTHYAGYNTISFVTLYWTTTGSPDLAQWSIKYTVSTTTFAKTLGHSAIELINGECTHSESGNELSVKFAFKIEWEHLDVSDHKLKILSQDDDAEQDLDEVSTGLSAETRLEDDSTFALDDGVGVATRGDYDTLLGIEASGAVSYLSSSLHPPTTEIDVYVNCNDGTANDNWEAENYEATGGTFSVDVDSDDAIGEDTYFLYAVEEGADHASSNLIYGDDPYVDYIADYMTFIATTSKTWTVVGETITVTLSGKYAYPDGNSDVPSVVWSNMDSGSVSYETMGLREWNYSSSGDTYGISKYFTTNASCVWDDVAFTSGPSYYWSQESPERVWFIWGVASAYEWDYNNSALQSGFLIQSIVNGTDNAYATTYGGSIGGLAIGVFGPEYYAANITITIDVGDCVIVIWYQSVVVDILHSLQIVNFNIVPTDYHFWITIQSNLMNASMTMWDDVVNSGTLFADNIYHSDLEGMHQIPIDDTVGVHNYTICITSYATHYDKDFTSDDYVWWYNFTNIVPEAPSVYETNIVIVDGLGRVIEFDTFDVYKNGSRIYASVTVTYSNLAYNITVKDRWGETLNSTVFDTGDHEFVIVVNVYSLKVMSWHEDFVFFNITHGGLTYYEVVVPLEPIEFELFAGTYDWVVDYRNETTVEGETTLTGSTAIIITGSTIADVAGYSATLLAMTTEINVTITATNNYVLTISIDLDNINTTINEQLIQVLLNITNTNSTIYSQAVDLLAYIQNVNSTLFDQTVDILVELNYISSNVTANFISVSAVLSAIDSNLYSNFTSVAATLLLIDSNLLSNFTSVSASLIAIDSSLLSNFTYVMANLTAIGSNITSNYLSVSATLSAIDSSLLSNFTSISAALVLIDSNLLSNFTSITSTLSAIGSNITSNYLSVAATLSLMDSNLLSNFTSVTATLSAIGSNITTNYLTISATLSMIDSSLLSNFTAIVAQLVSVNSSIASQFITVIAYAVEMNATMYLIDDPTHLNPLVLGYSLSDDYCDFTIVTTWHNSTIDIYDNDVHQAGPTNELLSPIRYPLLDTVGTHNLSLFIYGGVDSFWYNISYTIVETAYGEATIKAFYSSGIGIEDLEDKFIIYVNGSRSSDSFYNDTTAVYEICVTDFFGNEIYNATHSWAKFIDIEFDYYTLKVYSQIQTLPIYFTLTIGGSTISEYLGIGEILRYYLAAGTYTYTFLQGGMIYTDDLVLGVDYYYVVTDLDLWDLWNQPKGGGGDDDAVELYILNVLTFGILGLFGFVFIVQIPSIMNWLSGRTPSRQGSSGDRRRR